MELKTTHKKLKILLQGEKKYFREIEEDYRVQNYLLQFSRNWLKQNSQPSSTLEKEKTLKTQVHYCGYFLQTISRSNTQGNPVTLQPSVGPTKKGTQWTRFLGIHGLNDSVWRCNAKKLPNQRDDVGVTGQIQ